MGANKRYAEHYDALMDRRITEMLLKPTPVSLSAEELDTAADPVVQAREPVPARAWVRYPETAARVEGVVDAWTKRAVHMVWKSVDGAEQSAWIWSTAAEPIAQKPSNRGERS